MVEPGGGRERLLSSHTYFATARGLCTTCLAPCDGKIVFAGERALLRVTCPTHGPRESVLASSAAWYLAAAGRSVPWSPPPRPHTQVSRGCPLDCGPCASHGAAIDRLEIAVEDPRLEARASRAAHDRLGALRLDARASEDEEALSAALAAARRAFKGALEVVLPAALARSPRIGAQLARASARGVCLATVRADTPPEALAALIEDLAGAPAVAVLELIPERAAPGASRPTLPDLAAHVAAASRGRLDAAAFVPLPGVPPLCAAAAPLPSGGQQIVLHDLMDVETFEAGRALACPWAVAAAEDRLVPPCVAALGLPHGALAPARASSPAAASAAQLLSLTRGACPRCLALVDAARVERDGAVFLVKQCATCGPSEALLARDARSYRASLTCIREGARPFGFATEVARGCPDDCGLCPGHEQHSCLPIIEITNRCNLECPICLVDNRANWELTPAELDRMLDGMIAREGKIDTVNFSGGEPTLHPRFLELVDLARSRPEIARVSVSTNGVRLAADPELARELARRQVYVSLQLDATDNAALRPLRGPGDHARVREKALAHLRAAGAPTMLISTVACGANDDRIGDSVRALFEHDFVMSLLFQPAAYTGKARATAPADPTARTTLDDVIAGVERATSGAIRRSDFLPLPCSHPTCFSLCYLLRVDQDYVPFARFVPFDRYLDLVANRGTICPDEGFEQALASTIDTLWSSSGQLPDRDRILRTLKRVLRAMYPEDRALAIEERLRLGEASVKTLFIHAFMDAGTFDLERAKKCCTHYALPDGRLVPACTYNVLERHRDRRFTSKVSG